MGPKKTLSINEDPRQSTAIERMMNGTSNVEDLMISEVSSNVNTSQLGWRKPITNPKSLSVSKVVDTSTDSS